MKTLFVIELDHKGPLPSKVPLTDLIAQRVYGLLYANACESGVAVKEICRFPACNCPMDPGPDPDWCARGLAHVRSAA